MSLPDVAVGYRAFRLPRQGYNLEECQDALAGDGERGRFAIADGAAESPYAALWAQLLVEEFVRQKERWPRWSNWLPSLQERWSAQVTVHERWAAHVKKVSGTVSETAPDTFLQADVPWYLEPGLAQGAFATFLGLAIEDNNWYALAVGDSCLFQVRQGQLIRTFPIMRSSDFSNAPWLIGSRTSPIEVPHKYGVEQQGDCRPRDHLWLMTDALAQWFLIQAESGGQPWLALEPFLQASGAGRLRRLDRGIARARQLRNDDVTLLAVSV